MAAILAHFAFLLLAFSVSRSETDVRPVLLSRTGTITLCPNENATFTCRTFGGALLWRTTGEAAGRVFNDETQASSNLGIFRLSVTGVRKEGSKVVEVNSTAAMLTGARLEDDNITLTCLIATNFTSEMATLRVFGPPPAPVGTSIILLSQSSINNSSLLISWNMSDCAAQYVVTINSSDGSVYPNITTSDTSTTVTLPNGVEYCVTVAAVDAIGRRGQDSVPSCYAQNNIPLVSLPTPTTSTVESFRFVEPTRTGTSSPPTQSTTTDLVIIVVPIVVIMIIMMIVVVMVITCAMIILCRRKKSFTITQLDYENSSSVALQNRPATVTAQKYICQVFFQNKENNKWTFVFAASLKEHFGAVERYYLNRMDKKYETCDFQLKRKDFSIEISDLSHGWIIVNEPLTVSRTAVQQYNGVGEPPHCEMTVEAAEKDVTPSDLFFIVNINGNQLLTIEGFEFKVQNVIECSVQVFYYYVDINWWRVIVAFFPTKYQKQVEQIYQDVNFTSHQPLNFCGGKISILPKNATGWCISQPDDQKVNTAEIERYTYARNNKLPYCELTLKAVADHETPPDLSHTVTLFGAKKPSNIILKRVGMTPRGVPRPTPLVSKGVQYTAAGRYACQVFYYREGINHWRAVFTFFPEETIKRVKEIFQDANIGPAIAFTFPRAIRSTVKAGSIYKRKSNDNGWNVIPGKNLSRDEIKRYAGEDKPPHFEIIIKPLSENTTPSDYLTQNIEIAGINATIELRRAVDNFTPLANAVNSSANATKGPWYVIANDYQCLHYSTKIIDAEN